MLILTKPNERPSPIFTHCDWHKTSTSISDSTDTQLFKGILFQITRKYKMWNYTTMSEASKFPEGCTFSGSFIQLQHRNTIRLRKLAYAANPSSSKLVPQSPLGVVSCIYLMRNSVFREWNTLYNWSWKTKHEHHPTHSSIWRTTLRDILPGSIGVGLWSQHPRDRDR